MEKSLIQILESYDRVIIPIMQRDYAQGKKTPEIDLIRSIFVRDIIKNLGNEGKQIFHLDFIYGYTRDNSFYPIDGQQRLTTFWLFYWYCCFACKKVNNLLFKFSYETRDSSSQFMENLSKLEYNDSEEKKIRTLITEQNWFRNSWLHDPTIDSMLRMLDEIESQLKDKEIEKIHDGLGKERFSLLDISGYGLGDDLYIKMNGRGKPLTSFENFKNDLMQIISGARDIELKAETIDNDWLAIFWKRARKAGVSDKANLADNLLYRFIKAWCLDYLITTKNSIKVEGEAESREVCEEDFQNSPIRELYDDASTYKSIEIFSNDSFNCLDAQSLNSLKKLFGRITEEEIHDEKVVQYYSATYSESTFDFPFIEDKGLTQSNRCLLTALLMLYLGGWKGRFKEDDILAWLHVARNIITNMEVNTIPSMLSAMRLIHNLGMQILNPDKPGIYQNLSIISLSHGGLVPKNAPLQRYIISEEKAKAYLRCLPCSDQRFGEKLDEIEVEFSGQIAFLLEYACHMEYACHSLITDEEFPLERLCPKSFINVYENVKRKRLLRSEEQWSELLELDEENEFLIPNVERRQSVDVIANWKSWVKNDHPKYDLMRKWLLSDKVQHRKDEQPIWKKFLIKHPEVLNFAPKGYVCFFEQSLYLFTTTQWGYKSSKHLALAYVESKHQKEDWRYEYSEYGRRVRICKDGIELLNLIIARENRPEGWITTLSVKGDEKSIENELKEIKEVGLCEVKKCSI